jgi:hypothetical protein
MQCRLTLIPFLAALGLPGAAGAEELTTITGSTTEDGATATYVGFDYASCGGECYVGTLVCRHGTIELELADVAAPFVAEAIQQESDQIVVTAGGLSVGFAIYEMRYQEMNGSWWVIARSFDENIGALAAAIAEADEIAAQLGPETTRLPVDQNVRSWAAGCS